MGHQKYVNKREVQKLCAQLSGVYLPGG